MAKFKNLLSGLFPKTNSKLETDAAVIPRSTDDDTENKNENSTASGPAVIPNATAEVPGSSALVPTTTTSTAEDEPQQLQLVNPALTQNIVNNVQNNTLSGPQTTISAGGVHVVHIKNARNFQIGNSFTFNLATENGNKPTNSSGQVKWANLKLSETIREMMKSEDELDTGMMDTISRHLGYEWKAFARTLDYSEGQIEAFECDHKTLAEQIYQFVLDWSRNDDNPTLGRMVELLWENKHKETVYRMKVLWKERRRNAANSN
uniref:Death domain-containing protein n=1 Tax=Culex tarsalis TaxID=7177 RepID=A0A1Q3F829_CULTA